MATKIEPLYFISIRQLTLRPIVGFEKLSRYRHHGDLLRYATLGGIKENEAAIKIKIFPFQAEEFASPHADKQREFHHQAHIDVQILVDGLDERLQLIVGEIFRLDVVDAGGISIFSLAGVGHRKRERPLA